MLAMLVMMSVCIARAAAQDAPPKHHKSVLAAQRQLIGDKTLVAWATADNLAQRGGSILTLDDQGQSFDAIVFGEITPGKWMAGSNFYKRTARDQKT